MFKEPEETRKDQDIEDKLDSKRNRLLMDFDLLSTDKPREVNRAIFGLIILLILLAAGYVVSFYLPG